MAKEDWKRFSQSSFDLQLLLEAKPPSRESVAVKGIGTKNFIDFVNTDGQDAVASNAHLGVSEIAIKEINPDYPVRNQKGQVDLHNHRVTFENSNGVLKTYLIKQVFPDETVGMIMCDLADYIQNND